MERIPFTVQAGRPWPTHRARSRAGARVPAAARDRRRPPRRSSGNVLVAARHEGPSEQIAWCTEAVAARLEPRDLQWAGIDDVLVDRVASDGAGHRSRSTSCAALPFARPVLDDLRHALAHLRARMN